MATFNDLQSYLEKNPTFLGELVNNPKEALASANIKLDNEEDVKKLETLVHLSQLNIKIAADLINLKTSYKAEWGIGYGCCNAQPQFT